MFGPEELLAAEDEGGFGGGHVGGGVEGVGLERIEGEMCVMMSGDARVSEMKGRTYCQVYFVLEPERKGKRFSILVRRR